MYKAKDGKEYKTRIGYALHRHKVLTLGEKFFSVDYTLLLLPLRGIGGGALYTLTLPFGVPTEYVHSFKELEKI